MIYKIDKCGKIGKNMETDLEALACENTHALSLSLAELTNKTSLSKDSFSFYRERYFDSFISLTSNSLVGDNPLDCIGLTEFLSTTGDKLEGLVREHGIENLVLGVSGDLDSSFNLLILNRIIKERSLPCKIVAYNFQVKRVKRIEKLLSYLEKDFLPVVFFSYDISTSSRLLKHEFDIFENQKILPKSKSQVKTFHSKIDELKQSELEEVTTSKREKASSVHELSMTIKGRLLRKFPKSMLIGSINASEVLISNFTTSDLLVGFSPLIFLQKTVIAKMFRQLIAESHGGLIVKDWEFSLSQPAGFYPGKLSLDRLDSSHFLFSRDAKVIKFLREICVDINRSNLGKDFWDKIINKETGFEMPGSIQYHTDPYMFSFLLGGVSIKKLKELTEKYPEAKSDILMSAILYLSARELTVKDMYVAKMIS